MQLHFIGGCMMGEINIVPYNLAYEERWDKFVLEKSANGTILQTRKFLNYHPDDRFSDNSLLILKGSEIIGVIPANIVCKDKQKELKSHEGSTFGGIIIEKRNIKISVLETVFNYIDQYCIQNSINKICLKMTSPLYSREDCELLDYMLFYHGYNSLLEVGYYVDFSKYEDDIPKNYSSSVRRHFKASESNNLNYMELIDHRGISLFYDTLLDNYKKFGRTPVHSLEELFKLKDLLGSQIRFFGVFSGEEIVASSMVFDFLHRVFHTQYLAVKSAYNGLYVNESLYTNLIKTAKKEGFPYLSFGTATLDGGSRLNYNLAQYKEQYGTKQYINRTYYKSFD